MEILLNIFDDEDKSIEGNIIKIPDLFLFYSFPDLYF